MKASLKHHALPLLSLLTLFIVLLVSQVSGQNKNSSSSLKLARSLENSIQKTARLSSKRVVAIRPLKKRSRSADGVVRRPSRSGGSGVIIHASGFILTNDHVVDGVESCEVIFHNGQRVPGAVWARDEVGDLALVKVKVAWPLPVAKFGDSQLVKVGQPVIAVGNALGLSLDNGEPAVTFGILSGTHRYQGGSRVYGDALQFDAAVNPGNSGGGLFDLDGHLLGITGRISVRGTVSKSVGVGFAVPAHQIQGGLKDMMAGRDIVHGFLGVRFQKDAEGPGVMVAALSPNSPAELAGLRVTDVLLEINGVKLDHSVRLQNLLSTQKAGQKLTIKYRRGMEIKSVVVTLVRKRKSRRRSQ